MAIASQRYKIWFASAVFNTEPPTSLHLLACIEVRYLVGHFFVDIMPFAKDKAGAVLAQFLERPADIVVEAIPNLKLIAEDALAITSLIQEFKTNTAAWATFGNFVDSAVLQILQLIDVSLVLPLVKAQDAPNDAANASAQDDSKQNFERPTYALCDVQGQVKNMRSRSIWRRAYIFYQDPTFIEGLRRRLDDVLQLFQLNAVTHMGLNIDKVAEDVSRNVRYTQELNANLGQVAAAQTQQTQVSILDRLPYASQASWDQSKTCFPDTRRSFLEKLETWAHRQDSSSSSTAELMVVSGVVGSGKSTIMHTLAERCAKKGTLASAFFFDQAVEGRNNIVNLFTTLAVDLCGFNQELATQITASTSKDRGLSSATPLRQFEELVFKPLADYKGDKPLVILIDAVDEGINIQDHKPSVLLEILRDRIPHLPAAVRVVITYRTHPTMDSFFYDQAHVRSLTIDTRDHDTSVDIALFVRHELAEVSRRRHLGEGWPSEQEVQQLTERAEGLFQWAAMMCGHLNTCANPTRDLKLLIMDPSLSGASPEAKMDQLYKAVLDSYSWDDPVFTNGFSLVMGTILAAKTPLSSSALHSLHRLSSVPIDRILQQISSFTTGWSINSPSQPIQIMHQSLREYLTSRAASSSDTQRYFLSEKHWSQALALPCLNILNQQLEEATPGTGYILGTQSYEIPKFARNRISEELLYASQFWTEHLVDSEAPVSAALSMALRTFLVGNLVQWMEIVCVYGKYQGLKKTINWIMTNLPDRGGIVKHLLNPQIAKSLRILSQHLIHMDRPDEAVHALQDAVDLFQMLEPGGASFDADLSRSMRLLSTQLCEAGREDEAISAAETTLVIDRRLAEESPAEHTAQLASALDTYATVTSKAGRHEESLPHIREAVEIYQKLAAAEPGMYSDDLARCLNNLAAHLGRMGRHQEALPMIRDALSAYRYLAQEQPHIHTPHLANSLSNHYAFLSGAGRHEEALPHMEEAIALYRQLVAERPAAYTQDLATGLSNYAAGLSHLDRRVEALPVMRESIELLRALYTERPAAYLSDLAVALFNMSSHLNLLHQYAEALEVTLEAVELYKQLEERHPEMHSFSLASLYSRLHRNYIELDQDDDAFAAILEAVRYYREAKHSGSTGIDHQVTLAIALNSLSNSYAKMGLEEECLHPATEAVDILRVASSSDLDNISTRHAFGQGLLGLIRHLNRASKPSEAYIYATEVVDLYRDLATVLPTEYTDDLAEAYARLAHCLTELGRSDEALAAGTEQLSLYRDLATERPDEFSSKLLEAYVMLIKCFIDSGEQGMVMELTSEMMGVYRQVMQTNPGSLDGRLAQLYGQLAGAAEHGGIPGMGMGMGVCA
ncbi:POC1 centriolar protein A [Ceratobasidium sp. 428]|nr:POC1 centriolar protein A [Ceratobasidium sp. 428]